MDTKEIGENLFLIDLETGGFKNLIASYVLKGKEITVVETGPTSSVPNLLMGLKRLAVKLESVTYVAITHIHIDHGGGLGTLLRYLPNAKVIVHSRGAPHLKDPASLWTASKKTLGDVAEEFGKPESISSDRIIVGYDDMILDLGANLKLRVLETPGHASHNLSFYESLNQVVFPGDAAGAYFADFDTVFPTTPPPFRPDKALISLDKLIHLNPVDLCYSHFGIASNAIKHLHNYQIQIERWLMLIENAVNRGESEEVIREIVLESDDSIRQILPFLKSNPVHLKTLIENSVRGFVEFVKNPRL